MCKNGAKSTGEKTMPYEKESRNIILVCPTIDVIARIIAINLSITIIPVVCYMYVVYTIVTSNYIFFELSRAYSGQHLADTLS